MASDSHSHSLLLCCPDALAHGARAIAGSPAALALQSRRTAPFGTIQRERRRGPQCPNASPPGVAPDLTVCKCKECTERADVWTEIISERPEGATPEAWELLEALNNQFGAVDAVSQLTELERRCDYSKLGVPVRNWGLGPRFSRDDGSLNMENESARRRIPLDTLQNFEAARNGGRRFGPYRLEYRTGRYEKLEGVFEGVGETRGDWDMFTQFTADKDASGGVRDLACGHVVELGSAGRLPHSCGYSEVRNQLVLLQPEEGSTSTLRCSGTMSGYTRQYRTSATHSRGLSRTTRTEDFFGKTSPNGRLSSRALRTLSPGHFQLPSRQLAHSPKKGIRIIRRPHLRSHPHRPRRRPALVAPSSQTNIRRIASLVRGLMRNLARSLVRRGIGRTVGRQGRRRVICRARSH